jgi:hypothetical protein
MTSTVHRYRFKFPKGQAAVLVELANLAADRLTPPGQDRESFAAFLVLEVLRQTRGNFEPAREALGALVLKASPRAEGV